MSDDERLAMAWLLREYRDMFSSGNHDLGLAKAVRHEIPLAAGMAPIRQPTHRLRPKKGEGGKPTSPLSSEPLPHKAST